MKLKPTMRAKELPKEEPKTKKNETVSEVSKKKDSLKNYSDEYSPLFEPIRILTQEVPGKNDPTKMTKYYLEFKVMRYGDDGLPYVFVTTYMESVFYTGYTKKGIHFPLEMLYSVMEEFTSLDEKCQKLNL